jgi:tetratricopeptide (TPR) repeat protein
MEQTLINCPCGYGNNLGPENVTCPVCGLNLEPLHRIHAFPAEYFEKGKSCFEKNDFEKAEQYFLTCLSLSDSVNPGLNEYLGRCYLGSGNYNAADKYLRLAAGQNADNQDVKNLLEKLRKKKNTIPLKPVMMIGMIIISLSCFFLILSNSKAKHEIKGLQNTVSTQKESIASLKIIQTSGDEKKSTAQSSYSLLYHVKSGETLSLISYSIYGTDKKWENIFNANKGKIADPNFLEEHSTIIIPLDIADLK